MKKKYLVPLSPIMVPLCTTTIWRIRFILSFQFTQTLCWLVLANLTQTRVDWEDGTTTEELPPLDCPVGLSVEHPLDVGGPRALWVVLLSLGRWAWAV